jgi:NADPH-dependent 2,4-dienoyl-CoA reductase/sulfur reductase-like enzyme
VKRLRILVIGGLAAGPSAAAKAARTNPRAEVTLFEQTDTVSYGLCEAPYAISGEVLDEKKLVVYTPERLQTEKGIVVKTLHRVEKIFPTKHEIRVRDVRSGDVVSYEFDKLIITTGSSPRRLNVEGEDSRNVFHVSSREDTLNIMKYIDSEHPKNAVIIGGGYIGMEMSESLRKREMDVALLHRHKLPMAGLEEKTRERVVEELENNGVRFITNARVDALLQDASRKVVSVHTNKGSYETDLVILSLGVTPNVALAKDARIRLGLTGAISTDQRQQTNIDNIYSAGDCCEVKNVVTGKPMYIPLATIASRQAWVAGENAAGGKATFTGAIRAIAVRVFGLEVAQVGISSDEAREAGFDVATQEITAWSKVGIMPDNSRVTVKLIMDKRSKRVLGANLFGGNGTTSRANTLGVAIQYKMTVEDVSRFDMIYAPPFAPLWDPILIAANEGKKKM